MKPIFFLGPDGSYSHIITRQMFQSADVTLVPSANFSEIMKKVLSQDHSIGVLPIENSITSDIHENIDYLFKNTLTIINEAFLRINLHLMGLPGATMEDIQTVYSFERALAQCSNFIEKHKLQTHRCDSTAFGKKIAIEKQDKTIGVIGSRALGEDGTLSLIQENIGNDRYNMTRFVFVSKEKLEITRQKKNKASIIFKVPHISGSLAKLLDEIAKLKLNLTKIESRPIPGTNWEYQFWIDLEESDGVLDVPMLKKLLQEKTTFHKILGTYPCGKVFES